MEIKTSAIGMVLRMSLAITMLLIAQSCKTTNGMGGESGIQRIVGTNFSSGKTDGVMEFYYSNISGQVAWSLASGDPTTMLVHVNGSLDFKFAIESSDLLSFAGMVDCSMRTGTLESKSQIFNDAAREYDANKMKIINALNELEFPTKSFRRFRSQGPKAPR